MAPDAVIHVVDADAAHCRSLARLLRTAGFRAVFYETAEALLDAGSALLNGCVLLDIGMPGIDGLALQSELSSLGIRLPVIVTTQRGDVATAVRAIKAGAVDFLEKPFDSRHLLAAIEAALTGPRDASNLREATEAARRLVVLSARERQVLDGIVAGHASKVIAYNLEISMRTVEVHRARILDRLGTRSMAEAIRLAVLASLAPGASSDG
jgi:two-component system response regulator FixJ